jgi:uncharacterized protein YyaL (SSP411 family)
MANLLKFETSPYLLQHKNNPVHWVPWDEKFLKKAAAEDKLVLVSIGYSACHWCHVMEHEVFEDDACAAVMNEHFINMKVDREERPDIDHVYMQALQLMTGSGGWPLNCILLPDGRPVYGGTYFPKQRWLQVLEQLVLLWKNDRHKMEEYAGNLHKAMHEGALITNISDEPFADIPRKMVEKWKRGFDRTFGGPDKEPKFPLPNNYQFLLRYGQLWGDSEVMYHVSFTLKMMAFGGIYDQIGGGFSRYSVDRYWKVPHFEKMLYDNAQLISLYAEAYAVFKDPLFAEVVHDTIRFCERELKNPQGGWIAALDADSEGEEGKFYVWKSDEVREVLGPDFELAKEYFSINTEGFWEHGKYILLRQEEDDLFCQRHQLSTAEWVEVKSRIKAGLVDAREKRVRPGADDKILLGWNALMISALCDAYRYTRRCGYLESAKETWKFLESGLYKKGQWYRTCKDGEPKIPAFLEDLSFLGAAALSLAEVSFDLGYIEKAVSVTEIALREFWDEEKGFFRFQSVSQTPLTTETYEIQDNVIPSSNSRMALNLFILGRMADKPDWEERATQMARKISGDALHYGPGHSNWGILFQHLTDFREEVFTGEGVFLHAADFLAIFQPSCFVAAAESPVAFPLFRNRILPGKKLHYTCRNRACSTPEILH